MDVAYAGLTASATIEVKDVATDRPISFMTDVMPVFARAGCNTGSCHGAARGKDGFRLSLFGFDPRGDYYRLTREIGVRRINLAIPDRSLLIEKATGSVPHTGGKLMEKDSPYCQTLMAWLEAGAPLDAGEPPAVVGVDLYPPQAVIEGEKTHQQFIARARYSDGSDRDVTTLVRFDSNNGNSATISQGRTGRSRSARRGLRDRAVRHGQRGQPGDCAAQGPAVHGTGGHRQLHRRVGRRQAHTVASASQ